MYRFFIEKEYIDEANGSVTIIGDDVNHIKNVLRMKPGEKILLCTGQSDDPEEYLCEVETLSSDAVSARILDMMKSARELPSEIHLFQGLPKGDRFENIIEKSVELGVSAIIPVMTARTIVKLDEKRAAKKTERWNAIALAAAKQSKRSVIPKVLQPQSFAQAVHAAESLDRILVPYENAEGIAHTREVIRSLKPGESVGIFIGPEGGFADKEVEMLRAIGGEVITLGHRILRADTAPIAVLSMLMLHLENE